MKIESSVIYIYNTVFTKNMDGRVHHWYMTFGQQCCKTMCFSIKFKIKGWEGNTKGKGSTMVPPFGGNRKDT